MTRFRPNRLVFLWVTMALLFASHGRLSAQDVKYTQITDVEFGGALGTLMNFVPGGDKTVYETVFIKDARVRTDSDETSTVVDYAQGTIMTEDHKARTFYTLTFEQMLAAATKMREIANDGAEGTVASEEGLDDVDFEFKLSTDGSGQRGDVGGYDARQTILTVEVEGEATTAEDGTMPIGNLVLITDTWMSEAFPAHAAMQRAFETHGEEMRARLEELGTSASGMEAAFVHDPRLKAVVERNRDELERLDGVPVKSVSYFVVVPNGAQLDRDGVLATEGQPISEGLGSTLGRGASNAAADGARSAVRGRLGGLLGRGRDKPKEEEAATPDPQPSLIARVTQRVADGEETTLDAGLFETRDGYVEKMPQFFKDVIGDMERGANGR